MGGVAGKAGSFAKNAASRTGNAAHTARLAIKYRSAKGKLENMYTTLGKLFYEQTGGIDVRKQIAAQVAKINAQKKTVEELKFLIEEARGKMTCESCGKTIGIDSLYCPVCGSSQFMETIIKEPITKTKEEIIDDIINTKSLDTDSLTSIFKTELDKENS